MSTPSVTTGPQRSGTDRTRYRPAAPPWASGVVTGVETAVLSAGLVYAFAFAAVASAPSIDGSISVDWAGAWDVGTSVWLLAHGVPATAGTVTITLIPLGLTLAVGVIAASVARRVAVPAHASVACAALTYGAIAAVVAASDHDGAGTVWKAGIVGGVVTGMGVSLGLLRVHGFRFFDMLRFPGALGLGLRLGVGAWATCLALGVALAIAWQLLAVEEMTGVAQRLAPDLAGGLTLAAGETAYVPTLAVWALAWASGQGFALGSGSHYSPGEVVVGPVPEIPLLAALPTGFGGALVLAPLALVAVGVMVRVVARRWIPAGRAGYAPQAFAVVVVGGLTWGVMRIASGSAGGGVLAETGPRVLPASLVVAGLVGVGLLLASGGLAMGRGRAATSPSRSARRERPQSRQAAPAPSPRTPESTDPLRLW